MNQLKILLWTNYGFNLGQKKKKPLPQHLFRFSKQNPLKLVILVQKKSSVHKHVEQGYNSVFLRLVIVIQQKVPPNNTK